MDNSAAQVRAQHRPHRHRHRQHRDDNSRPRHQHSGRKRTMKIVQRLAILFFILIVMLAFLYVWVSSGSSESTTYFWQSSPAQAATDIPSNPSQIHSDLTPNPISPCAVSKLAGEYYMRSFHAVYGVETVSLRYFNVFGPYQDPKSMYTGVIAIFIPKILRQERPTIYGDGEQSRDFTYINNVVKANLLACHAPADQVAGRYF